MGAPIRLDKLLSDTGRWSRKEARELIRRGAVTVDDQVLRTADRKVDPTASLVMVDGAPLRWQKHVYYLLHKPAGYLTATEDKHASTVLELVPPELRRTGLAPVGRLDKDTTGLLLLTDDGELNHALCSPRHHVDKVYLARVEGNCTQADVAAFAAGLTLGDGTRCRSAGLEPLGPGLCRVTVAEGKFHQVKRMLSARGMPVLALKRLSMGPLSLEDSLKEGQIRPLTETEVENLRTVSGCPASNSSK